MCIRSNVQPDCKMRLAMKLFVLTFVWEVAMASHALAAEFSGLGTIPGRPEVWITATSGDGSRVVGWSKMADDDRSRTQLGFIWSQAEGIVALEPPFGFDMTQPKGISGDGSVIVGELVRFGPLFHGAFKASTAHDAHLIPDIFQGAIDIVNGVSGDGSTVYGVDWRPSGSLPFRRGTDDSPEPLGLLPGDTEGWANGASTDGSVIVGESTLCVENSCERKAFRWTQDTGMVELGDLPGGSFHSHASDTSGDGSVVVGVSRSERGLEGFRWTEAEKLVALGDLPGGSRAGRATSISADGNIIVGLITGGRDGVYIWDEVNGARDLVDVLAASDLEGMTQGWDLTAHPSNEWGLGPFISADGTTIVGTGINPDGQFEGWRATLIVPEPGSSSLVAVLALVLAARRRRVR